MGVKRKQFHPGFLEDGAAVEVEVNVNVNVVKGTSASYPLPR